MPNVPKGTSIFLTKWFLRLEELKSRNIGIKARGCGLTNYSIKTFDRAWAQFLTVLVKFFVNENEPHISGGVCSLEKVRYKLSKHVIKEADAKEAFIHSSKTGNG